MVSVIKKPPTKLPGGGRGVSPRDGTTGIGSLVDGSVEDVAKTTPALKRMAGEKIIGADMPELLTKAPNQAFLESTGYKLPNIEAGFTNATEQVANAAGKVANAAEQVTGRVTKVIGEAATPFKMIEPIESIANTASTVGGFAEIAVPVGLGAAALGTKLVGHKGANNKIEEVRAGIKAASESGQITTLNKITNAAWIGGNALGVYGVAKGFTEELDSLKNMYADIAGVPVDKVSTIKLFTGSVPQMLEEPRRHLMMEYGVRAAIQTLGLAWIVKDLKKGHISMKAGMVPFLAGSAADMVMGSSLMPVYAKFKNAYNTKQEIGADAYAEFVLSGSSELKKSGDIGRMVAAKMGEKYAAEKTDPGIILKSISDGSFVKETEPLTIAAKAEYDVKVAADKKAKLEAEQAKASGSSENEHSGKHVSKLLEEGKKPAEGKFVQRIGNETTPTLGITS